VTLAHSYIDPFIPTSPPSDSQVRLDNCKPRAQQLVVVEGYLEVQASQSAEDKGVTAPGPPVAVTPLISADTHSPHFTPPSPSQSFLTKFPPYKIQNTKLFSSQLLFSSPQPVVAMCIHAPQRFSAPQHDQQ
jgi:hypothetical protein